VLLARIQLGGVLLQHIGNPSLNPYRSNAGPQW